MVKRNYLALAVVLALVTGLSCDRATGLPTTGGINVVLLSESQTALVVGPLPDGAPDVAFALSDNPLNVLLDGVRVTVSGPTNKTETVNTASGGFFSVTVSGLEPGSYTVVVEGLVGGKVAHYGQQQGVSVAAGANTSSQVTFPKFVPGVPITGGDTSDVLRFTVSFTGVTNATSYVVDWSTSAAMTNPQSKTITGTTTDITVTSEGTYFYTVRAVNAAVGTSGLPSSPRPVFVFQGVATVTVTPASPTINAGASQQFAAEARDADNAVVPSVAWFWSSSNQSAAIVDQTGLVTGVGSGGATITAVGKGTPGSASVTVNALPATKLAFLVQPANAVAGMAISPAVQVEVQNANNARVTGSNAAVTITIGTNPASGTLSGTMTVNAINGVASFSGLSINKAGTGYNLSANSGSLSGALSAAFDILATPAPSKLAFTIQPSSSVAGAALSPAIQVEVQDANGNRVTDARDEVTIGFDQNPGSGTLTGTKKVNAINGIASFTGLWIDKAALGYSLSATATNLALATSGTFTIVPGAKAKLAFVAQPTTVAANTAIAPSVTVRFTDQFDNPVPVGTDNVTISLGGSPWKSVLSPGGSVSGTITVAAVAGLATFNDLRVDKPGAGFSLSATIPGTQITGLSSTFNVTLSLTQLSIGYSHVCGLGASGTGTFCWGNNESGQLGTLLGFTGTDSIPSLARGGLIFTSISAGNEHTCGLTATNDAYCWGNNESGQLGNNSTVSSDVPVLVTGAHKFSQLAAGGAHTCGITTAAGGATENQQVYCWGYNYYGQLGNNAYGADTANKPFPVRVSEPLQTTAPAISISAGYYNTCAVGVVPAGPTRNMYCWGYGGNGVIGDNLFTDSYVPKLVPVAFQWSSVALGKYNHVCGIRLTTNTAYCWGANYNGQLGDGTTNSSGVPVPVTGVSTWISLAGGAAHTCGIVTGGAAQCWGYNGYGNLGDGTTTDSYTPKPVTGGLTFTSLRAGGYHNCGRAGTAVYCWGANWDGQLGNAGNGNFKITPTQIAQ